jgi:hypothetical protein
MFPQALPPPFPGMDPESKLAEAIELTRFRVLVKGSTAEVGSNSTEAYLMF